MNNRYEQQREQRTIAVLRRGTPMAEHGHGHSTAAWTAVTILLVAAALICLAVVVTSWALAIVGIVLSAVGLGAGKVLAMAGLGATGPDRPGTSTDGR